MYISGQLVFMFQRQTFKIEKDLPLSSVKLLGLEEFVLIETTLNNPDMHTFDNHNHGISSMKQCFTAIIITCP